MDQAETKFLQIRWYARSALNGFDTLDPEDAVANAQSDLSALIAYLDKCCLGKSGAEV